MVAETMERDGIVYERAGFVVEGVVYVRAGFGQMDVQAVAQRVAESMQRRRDGIGRTGPELVTLGDRT